MGRSILTVPTQNLELVRDLRAYWIWNKKHSAWRREPRKGYTRVLSEAGIYDQHQTERILSAVNRTSLEEVAIPAMWRES